MVPITVRPPTFSPAAPPADFKLPTIAWLMETWHVTHSTLPMWKSKRNVRIQYTPLDPSSPEIAKEHTDRVDDLVSYQGLTDDKVSTVRGIDKAATTTNGESRGEWDWRGKGWLKIASSHWEVLAWGEEEGTGNKWMVTMFAKTLFTPAGIDVYSKAREGVQAGTLNNIKAVLSHVDDSDVQEMAGALFEIQSDDSRTD
ncbi:Hypothetical predicted protein [Lecanosticta acicola]|uniref:Uncharacterized protein n=1 Tax=Lecanosticta acicola TaxID=111012 RepID=A0AAI9EDS1_9PEZI|nr:Hypothetical predicted protein [Lecanosticta acicola]